MLMMTIAIYTIASEVCNYDNSYQIPKMHFERRKKPISGITVPFECKLTGLPLFSLAGWDGYVVVLDPIFQITAYVRNEFSQQPAREHYNVCWLFKRACQGICSSQA